MNNLTATLYFKNDLRIELKDIPLPKVTSKKFVYAPHVFNFIVKINSNKSFDQIYSSHLFLILY